MKKLVLFVLVTLGVFALSACGVKEQFQDGPELKSLEGVVTEQKNSDPESGTHFLTMESGKKVALRSLQLNLSKEDYLSKKVEITGVMDDEEGVFVVESIKVVGEAEAEEDVNDEIVDYQNETLGFKTKYSAGWRVVEGEDAVDFNQTGEDGKSYTRVLFSRDPFVYHTDNPEENVSLSALGDYYRNELLIKDGTLPLEKIGADSLDSLKVVGENTSYIIYRNGYIYTLMFIPGDEATRVEDENLFKLMVLEFRFIPFGEESVTDDEIADEDNIDESSEDQFEMTAFESLPYSFKGKYPASWYYAGVKSPDPKVLHHYGFAQESVDSTNEIIGLDILAGSIPTKNQITYRGRVLSESKNSETIEYYFSVEGQNYRLSGPIDQKSLLQEMAASIQDLPQTALEN